MSAKALLYNTALCGALVLWGFSANLANAAPANASDSSSNAGTRSNVVADALTIISAAEARRMAVNNNLTGRRALPPGIQRNLARGKPLPPGIARQLVPQSMLASLPAYPEHEWRIAGDDLLLVTLGTQLVVEILNDVFQ